MKNLPKLYPLLVLALAFIAIRCGGDDPVTTPTGPTTFSKISAGGRHTYNAHVENGHTCGISEGTLWCWGANGEGQLGTGDRVPRATPKQVGSDTTWTDVATGGGYTCGINDGKLYCWGSNKHEGKFNFDSTNGTNPDLFYGLLGLGSTYDKIDSVDEPTQVGTSNDWTQVSVGNNSACAILSTKSLYCWGFAGEDTDSSNRLGLGATIVNKNVPAKVGTGTDWIAVSVGNRGTTIGIRGTSTKGTLWYFGQSFSGLSSDAVDPTEVDVDGTTVGIQTYTDWSQISTGNWNACGIRTSGSNNTLWCWGNSRHGQAGQGDVDVSHDFTVPADAQVGTSTKWTSVDSTNGYVCGVNSGKLYCWGRNYDFELGLGKTLSAFDSCVTDGNSDSHWDCGGPELVDADNAWTSVSTGNNSSCGIIDGGDLYCWGANFYNQTGVADPAGSIVMSPTKVN